MSDDPTDDGPSAGSAPLTGLEEVLARGFLTTDAARPEKVARLTARGRRTARANLADLVDEGSFVEYGRFVTAAQEQRRHLSELVVDTPADGLVGGTATVDGLACVVLSYDWMVQAGTQGVRGHQKTDRLLDLAIEHRWPAVFFTEGGGGRPSDTDVPTVSALDVGSFSKWAALGAVAPRIAVVSGRCFAGNAVLAGSADLRVATPDANLGMAGPAMIAGGGLGTVSADEIGPVDDQVANGVIDVLVDDEEEAVVVARRLLGLLNGARTAGVTAADQTGLRHLLPANERETFDVHEVVELLVDDGSAVRLREAWAPELVTVLARLEGAPVGIVANQSTHLAGALTADASTKAADFLELCERWRIPVVSLVDCPGFMVGPEAERTGLVRSASRMVNVGARLTVPLVGVVLRRAYGLGAQAMLGGDTRRPLMTLAWPGSRLAPMGLEGAVRLAMAKELAALPHDDAEALVRDATALATEQAAALNAARLFEIDDVIDPADTRPVVARLLSRAATDR